LSLVDELRTIWSLSDRVTLGTNHQIEAILAADAMAIRPVITIYENVEIEGIEDVNNLTSPDIFPQLVLHPIKFHEFIFQHWGAAYSSLFVYQLQLGMYHLSVFATIVCLSFCPVHRHFSVNVRESSDF
jgi:hypothetical protein